jgi:hypothetical protein
MALRAKKPEAVTKRLKLFMFGPAGVGKTTAAIQFPKSYIIDAERGAENYDKLINQSGSVILQTTNIDDVIAEERALLTEPHEYRTLVIDPITPLFNDLLDKAEAKVGSEFGRHYGEAKKQVKRLTNLLMALDMNVVITAHAKTEYGQKLEKLGITFDGPRGLDYLFDLVVELDRQVKRRIARVRKTRLEGFPDGDSFDWSYEAITERYDASTLERTAQTVALASPDQIKQMQSLLAVVRLEEGTVEKWFAKAGVEDWSDMPAAAMAKCIEHVKAKLPKENQ